MIILIICFPLWVGLILSIMGRFLGFLGAERLIFYSSILQFSIFLYYFYLSYSLNFFYYKFGFWFNSELVTVTWGILFDSISLFMCLIIIIITNLVLYYSKSYMSKDPHKIRFYIYLSLFSFFMLVMVVSDNFIQLFLGWEGIGFCSFLLISFWNTRSEANKAAIKAILVNKIGDLSLLVGCSLLFFLTKSFLFEVNWSLLWFFYNSEFIIFFTKVNSFDIIVLFFTIAIVAKSAQFFLYIWLPDAMEGPTPVSALLHAATMVTAGIFLLVRCSVLFEYSYNQYHQYSFLAGFTALFAAILGCCHDDLKKSIAFSTCSQIGYMFLVASLSSYSLAFFHLINHAFFKALLFLSAGCIIHNSLEEQDIRSIGNHFNQLVFVNIITLVGLVALIGIPFFSGFYSKDLIISFGFLFLKINGFLGFFFGLLAAGLTTVYSCLNYYDIFFLNNNYKIYLFYSHKTSKDLIVLLSFLGFCSLFFGYCIQDYFIGLGSDYFSQQLWILPNIYSIDSLENLSFFFKILPIVFIIFFFFISFEIKDDLFFLYFYYLKFFNIDLLFKKILNKYIKSYSFYLFFHLDKGFFELFGPKGIIYILFFSQKNFRNYSPGFLSIYIQLYFFLGFFFLGFLLI